MFKKEKEIRALKSDLYLEREHLDTVYQLFLNAEERTGGSPTNVWPTLSSCYCGNISNSTLFFNGITNYDYFKQFDYDYLSSMFFDSSNNSKWNVLIGSPRDVVEKVPLIFSSGIDPQVLICSMKSSFEENLARDICVGPGLILIKDYGIITVVPNYFRSKRAEANGHVSIVSRNWPDNLRYLTPTGVVEVVVRD